MLESGETGISVAIRIRPFNQRELKTGEVESALVNDHQSILVRSNPPNQFNFDHVLDDSSANVDVYQAVASEVVQNALLGINGTIFAYGQTSTGKTHTMFGSKEELGVMPLATKNIFKSIAMDTGREYLLRASYIEIYNENIRDLLNPNNDNLKIHQNPQGEIFVGDLSEQLVSSISEINELLAIGDRNRRIGETNMNEKSSRSHTIFRLTIESRERPKFDGQGTGAIRVSLLNLVDLAGSERVGHTGAEGQRLIEGGHINKSLLALGTVISKLSEGDSLHIPYRDSKLTRILQSSLGGNARTSIVCTVTPAMFHMDETLSTLRFATRAKKITNRPKVNEVLSDSALLKLYRQEINDLKRKLDQVQCQSVETLLSPVKAQTKRRKTWDQASTLSPAKEKLRLDEIIKQKQTEESYQILLTFLQDFTAGESSAPVPPELQDFVELFDKLKSSHLLVQSAAAELQEQNQFLNMEFLSRDEMPTLTNESSVQTSTVVMHEPLQYSVEKFANQLTFDAITLSLVEITTEEKESSVQANRLLTELYQDQDQMKLAISLLKDEVNLAQQQKMQVINSVMKLYAELFGNEAAVAPTDFLDTFVKEVKTLVDIQGQDIIQLQEMVTTIQQRNEDLEEENGTINAQVQDLQSKIDALQIELSRFSSERDLLVQTKEVSVSLEAENQAMASKILEYQSKIENIYTSIKELQVEKTDLLATIRVQAEEYAKEIEQVEQRLQAKLLQAAETIQKLQEAADTQQFEQDNAKVEYDVLLQQTKDMQALVGTLQDENSSLNEQLLEAKDQKALFDQLFENFERTQQEYLQLLDRFETIENTGKESESEKEDALNNLKSVSEQCKVLNSEKQALEVDKNNLLLKVQSLQEQLENEKEAGQVKHQEEFRMKITLENAKSYITGFNVKFHGILSKFEDFGKRMEAIQQLADQSQMNAEELIIKNKELEELKQDVQILADQVKAVSMDLQTEKDSKAMYISQIELLEQEKMVQSVQQREVEDRVREKEEIIETLESKIADLQEQVQALFNDLQKSGALSTANNEQVLKLKQELEASEQRQLDDKQRIEEKYQAEAEVLKQQISNLKDRNLYLETNLEKSNTKCAAMEQRVKMMERESNPVSLPLGDSKIVNIQPIIESKPSPKKAPEVARKPDVRTRSSRLKSQKAKQQSENIECNQQ